MVSQHASPSRAAPAPMARPAPAGQWQVRVGERVYGPYSEHQMRGYIAEGRIGRASEIAPAGTSAWRAAGADAQFARLFAPLATAEAAPTDPAKADPARTDPARTNPERASGEGLTQFMIYLEDRWRSDGRLIEAIHQLGTAFRILPSLWAVSSRFSAQTIRNHLGGFLDDKDTLIVVDATAARIATYNVRPDVEHGIRSAWQTH